MVEHISITILDGNLTNDSSVNLDRLATDYARLLEEAVSRAYPDAEVEVRVQRNTQGRAPDAVIDGKDVDDEAVRETLRQIDEHLFSRFAWGQYAI
jgi:hypothetical protein